MTLKIIPNHIKRQFMMVIFDADNSIEQLTTNHVFRIHSRLLHRDFTATIDKDKYKRLKRQNNLKITDFIIKN